MVRTIVLGNLAVLEAAASFLDAYGACAFWKYRFVLEDVASVQKYLSRISVSAHMLEGSLLVSAEEERMGGEYPEACHILETPHGP